MGFQISNIFDTSLDLLKWPTAIAAVVVLPGTIQALWQLLGQITNAPAPLYPFLIGFIGYFLAWKFFFRHHFTGSFLSTLEHELTHAIIAIATFHPVTGISSSWKDGGKMTYSGKGNWLITIAPYFLPTISVVLALSTIIIPDFLELYIGYALGATIAYHMTSTWRETHRGQTDLQKVGFGFALVFLPAANLVSYGVLIEFYLAGTPGMMTFLIRTIENTQHLTQGFGLF